MTAPGLLDGLLDGLPGASSFPWSSIAEERPELIALVEALAAHGLLATAIAGELRRRGWVADGSPDLEARLAAAVDRRFIRGARTARDLPWRRTRDPYAILVSEIMLQQTQVDRVVPRYLEWLERWPTSEALAAASPAEVIRAWQGLGYNRRGLALHRAAQHLAEHGWPDDLTVLPGVGPYTAAAVRNFAFREAVLPPGRLGRWPSSTARPWPRSSATPWCASTTASSRCRSSRPRLPRAQPRPGQLR